MMKKRVLTSVAASAALIGALAMSGCGGSSSNAGGSTSGGSTSGGSTSGGSTSGGATASIIITDANGRNQTINPTQGGTVVIRHNSDGTHDTAAVVGTPLNECANATTDPDGDGVICGPESNVTYAFQSDFGTLGGIAGHGDGQGDLDDNRSTYDGGVLLYDAYTLHNGQIFATTPVEGNASENRIQEVYIPTNYIMLTDAKKSASVDEQYNTMRTYLANVCNMQCFAAEPDNNPYFTDGKTKGSFVATFVMHFTRGEGEDTLMPKLQNDTTDLEYLAVSFQLDVEQVDGNSSKLRFSSPADTPVDFYGKKHGQSALSVTTSNIALNSIVHQTVNADDALTINMAKYFDKLIAKGDSVGVADYAKAVLVENAQHPWPVKIYGTLHEMKDDGSIERSFVRNPGKLDAELFGLTTAGAWQHAFDNDANKSAVKAEKFNIVYPNGTYNDLSD